MLQGNIRQLRCVIRQGIQRQTHTGEHQTALIGVLCGDIGDGGSRTHIDHNNGSGILLQRRHCTSHEVSAQLVVILHTDIQSCFHTGTYHHGRLTQQTGQRLLHHKVHRRNDAGKNGTVYICDGKAIQCEQIHQINTDLVCSFPTVRVNGGKKLQHLLAVKQSHGYIGVTNVDGQQHSPSSLSSSLFSILP